jgi:phosphate-selective porin OprO/OprP
MKVKNKLVAGALFLLANNAFAEPASGLMYGSKSEPFWFKVGGGLKFDHRAFFGDTKNSIAPKINNNRAGNYYTGSALRETSVKFEGGIGADYQFSLGFSYDAAGSAVNVDEAFVTYNGFRDLMPNFGLSVGQVNPSFALEATSSSKWTPFMEKSLGGSLFGPEPGLGFGVSSFNKSYSLALSITNPKPKAKVVNYANTEITRNDHGLFAGRATISPINSEGRLLQFGASVHYTDHANSGQTFSVTPEARARHNFPLLNTNTTSFPGGVETTTLVSAKDRLSYDLEIMGQYGSWSGEAEYQAAKITRGTAEFGALQGADLSFKGYHAQVAYVLTGEVRKRNDASATLGQIVPSNHYGAVEAALRYSHLNLNSKDIFGGKANNVTASVSWYANNNIRLIGEYVISQQERSVNVLTNGVTAAQLLTMNVQSLGARLQFVF